MNVEADTRFAAVTATVTVTELPARGRFSIRAGAESRAAAEQALGLALPARIGERRTLDTRSALCLGPDEWMVHCAKAEADTFAAALARVRATAPLSDVDISDREVTLEIEGPAALDLLATGCPLDLAAMPVGSGTRTIFDYAQVVLTREADDRFRVEVWQSFLPHVRSLMDTAAREIAIGL